MASGNDCDILQKAFQRYEDIIFSNNRITPPKKVLQWSGRKGVGSSRWKLYFDDLTFRGFSEAELRCLIKWRKMRMREFDSEDVVCLNHKMSRETFHYRFIYEDFAVIDLI